MIWAIFGLGGGGGGADLLAQKVYAMPKCKCVEIGIKTNSQRIKNKHFTILTSNKTAIIPKIVIFKPCMRQSVSIYILNPSKV